MPAEPLVTLSGVHKSFGAFKALSDITLSVAPGEKVGLAQECALESTSLDLVFNDVQTADGNDTLIWPHCDGLIWPRPRHSGVVVTV